MSFQLISLPSCVLMGQCIMTWSVVYVMVQWPPGLERLC